MISAELQTTVLQFASFLGRRLGSHRISISAEHPAWILTSSFPSTVLDAAVRPIEDFDLPVFVEPWNLHGRISLAGASLINNLGRHRLSVVVEGPRDIPAVEHVEQLRLRLKSEGWFAPLVGALPGGNQFSGGAIALVENRAHPLSPVVSAPAYFTVVAFMMTYNEADIVRASIRDLRDQGIGVYLIDNWSTDGTYEIAESLLGDGVVGLERYPLEGPPEYYDLRSILVRVEELSSRVKADWFIKHDADEIRRSPWEGLTLRDAIYRVDVAGFDRIDFTIVDFPPTDNGFIPGTDFTYFHRFDWARHPAHFVQQRAWKNHGIPISLTKEAAHIVEFEGAKTFPYKFLMHHYPIRSQTHGERKIFLERKPRLLPEARARGWHNHYDRHALGQNFLAAPDGLMPYDDQFFSRYFIERLSGVGIERWTATSGSEETKSLENGS